MVNDILEKAIEEEVENRVKDFKLNYEINSKKIREQDGIIESLTNENNKLRKENNNNKNRKKLLDLIQKIYTKDTLCELIYLLHYEKVENIGTGMDTEEIDPIFKLIFEQYNNKCDILNICDMLNIEYPEWYINYKMPYDYDINTVKLFLKKLSSAYVTNSCIYENNIGFFSRNINRYQCNENELIKNEMYHDIPWQLFLKNKLLLNDDIWNIILDKINKEADNSYYFFAIDLYQKLDNNKLKQLFDLAINSRHSEAKDYIKRHMELLKYYNDIAEQFKDEISFENYKGVHFSKFPKNMQIDYLKKLCIKNLNIALEDSRCELTNNEKRELMIEAVNKKWE